MSSITEWFEGRQVDEQPASWTQIVIEVLCMACLGALLAVAIPGCSTADAVKVCYVKPMGQTDQGYLVIAQQCMTPEAFAESQK